MRVLWKLALLALLCAVLSCKSNVIEIKTLLDDPSRYDHQTVRIAGEVKTSVGVMGYGGYQVDDGTAQLLVVTNTGGAPREGAKVGVEGEFRSAYTVGSQTGAVLIEKKRFTP